MEKLQQDLWVPVGDGERLYLKRIGRAGGEPVLMVHGVMANGRTFYTESGKGLAHYLADAGYDVYVADLRGRGRSTPKIGPHSRHGQTETICEDLPALHGFVRRKSGGQRVHWIAHSWGGVHMTSCLVRFPDIAAQVASAVYFGSKRSVRVRNLNKLIEVDFMWGAAARWLIKACGYLPARRIRLAPTTRATRATCRASCGPSPNPGWTATTALTTRPRRKPAICRRSCISPPPTIPAAATRRMCAVSATNPARTCRACTCWGGEPAICTTITTCRC